MTAAGHAVVVYGGGHVLDLHGDPLRYGKPGFENPQFVVTGKESRKEESFTVVDLTDTKPN